MLMSVEQDKGNCSITSGVQPTEQIAKIWKTELVVCLHGLCSNISMCLHWAWALIMRRRECVTSTHNLMDDDEAVKLAVEKEEDHENIAWNSRPVVCLCGLCSHKDQTLLQLSCT